MSHSDSSFHTSEIVRLHENLTPWCGYEGITGLRLVLPLASILRIYWLLCLIILFLPILEIQANRPVFVRPSRSKGHDSYILVESSWFASKLLRCFSKTFDEPPPRKLTAYSARRGGATAYAKAGLQKSAIKEILRHKNEATTEDYIQILASVADSLEVAEIFS